MPLDFHIERFAAEQSLPFDWDLAPWPTAQTAVISNFLPQSSNHRPEVFARLGWSGTALHGFYKVADRYVRCVRTQYFEEVWKDSCVEFFVQPRGFGGYFNFEFNCGGAFLCNYITDHRRGPTGFAKAEKLPEELARRVQVRASLPPRVDPEITDAVTWYLQFTIPFAVMEPFVGPLQVRPGERWRGNFFKCAEEISHPHWASWAPVPEFNFHLPECFGDLVFA